MTTAGRPAQRSGANIGSVLAQLRAEFPDVTISKIRFLESEGLVCPQRTAAGYRQFSPADIERLRYVLAAQRDYYLPLKVIKEHLEAMDRGERQVGVDGLVPRPPRALVGVPDGGGFSAELADLGIDTDTADTTGYTALRVTQEELIAAAGIAAADLAELERFGLVGPGPAGFYDTDAVQVAKTVRAMTDFGLEPRHLRAFRASADREVGLLAQIVTPVTRQRDPDARARAEEVVRQLAVLSVRLHALLVRSGLRSAVGG